LAHRGRSGFHGAGARSPGHSQGRAGRWASSAGGPALHTAGDDLSADWRGGSQRDGCLGSLVAAGGAACCGGSAEAWPGVGRSAPAPPCFGRARGRPAPPRPAGACSCVVFCRFKLSTPGGLPAGLTAALRLPLPFAGSARHGGEHGRLSALHSISRPAPRAAAAPPPRAPGSSDLGEPRSVALVAAAWRRAKVVSLDPPLPGSRGVGLAWCSSAASLDACAGWALGAGSPHGAELLDGGEVSSFRDTTNAGSGSEPPMPLTRAARRAALWPARRRGYSS
jgi:hypothetical protein